MKNMISLKSCVLILSFLGLAACGPVEETKGLGGMDGNQKATEPYRPEPALGSVNGTGWVFMSGTARAHFNNSSQISLTLSDVGYADPCVPFNLSKSGILTSVPASTGEAYLNTAPDFRTLTFFYPKDDGSTMNLVTGYGRIAITELNSQYVSGYLIAQFDNANYVNGSFKLKVCR